ncbi:MAG: DUF1080 domain-containing protein [Verrucomicrobiota bacterium]
MFLSCLPFSGCISKTIHSDPVIQPTQKITLADSEQESRDLPTAILSLNGKNLSGWKKTDFGGRGEISVANSEIKIEMGAELSGVNWTNAAILPKTNYEIELEAMKLEGSDFFCGLTIPFSNSFCTFVVGGWGGGIVGISSINGADASENDTTRNLYFEKNRWFHIRVRVTPEKITAWIDQDKVVDLEIGGRRISMRGGDIERSVPLGIATWQTSAVIRNIRLKGI